MKLHVNILVGCCLLMLVVGGVAYLSVDDQALKTTQGESAKDQGVTLGPIRAPSTVTSVTPKPAAVNRGEDAAVQELVNEAQRLKDMARYPSWSQPLDIESDSLAIAEHEQLDALAASKDGRTQLRVLLERSSFDAPEPVTLRARVTGHDAAHSSELAGWGTNGHGHSIALLSFVRDSDDAQNAGGWYVAAFTLKELQEPNAVFTVHVVGTLADEHVSVDVPIVYNQSNARLTGRFRDALDNGDLAIEAEVNVTHSAEFSVDASLYAHTQYQPITSYQFDELDAKKLSRIILTSK